jgi:hypothetical protein
MCNEDLQLHQCKKMTINMKEQKGQKMTLVEVLKKDMVVRALNENVAPDEIEWYCGIKRSVSFLVYKIHELISIFNKKEHK